MFKSIVLKIKNFVFIIIVLFICFFLIKFSFFKKQAPEHWYHNLVFTNKSFSAQLIRRVSHSLKRGSDIGECFATAQTIKNNDTKSWYAAWHKTANRIYSLAQDFEAQGHTASARECFFRAANYYQSAAFYMTSPNTRTKALKVWEKSRASFLKAIESLPNVAHVRIPYQNTTLPAYFIKAHNKPAPLLIVTTGFDGTAEETYWTIAPAAQKRGYHCLIFEGPGQGEMIIKQNIPFRHDWEHVITPVINFATTLPKIDITNIILMGRSMGGCLAPRATAFDKRIKACIANGGIFDFSENLYKKFPKPLLALIEKSPDKFNIAIRAMMKNNVETTWFFENGIWRFHAKNIADFMQKLKQYNLQDVAQKITCPTLIVDSEGETFFLRGQAKKLYDALICKKDFILFTAEEAAQAHCQLGANMIANEKIFNWLDDNLPKAERLNAVNYSRLKSEACN